MSYEDPDIVSDETTITEAQLAHIAARIPGWDPALGHTESVIAEANGIAIASAITELKADLADAYRGFGLRILGIDRQPQTPAIAVTSWTFSAGEARTYDAGAEANLTLPSGEPAPFVLVDAVEVAASVSPTTITGIEMMSVDVGADQNGATNPALPAVVGVDSIAVVSPSAGGEDEEDGEEYINKIADRARRMHAIPITPEDHAAIALDHPTVARCAAVNRLDPADPGVDSPGHLTLFTLTSTGTDQTPGDRSELEADFAAIEKIIAAEVHVEPVPREPLTIAITIKATPDAQPTLGAEAKAAILAGHHPAFFDRDDSLPGKWLPEGQRTTEINVFTVAALVDDLPGLQRVQSVTINGSTTPVTLAAPLTIPDVGDADVTVTVIP